MSDKSGDAVLKPPGDTVPDSSSDEEDIDVGRNVTGNVASVSYQKEPSSSGGVRLSNPLPPVTPSQRNDDKSAEDEKPEAKVDPAHQRGEAG